MHGQPDEGPERLRFPAAPAGGESRRAGRFHALVPLASLAVGVASLLGFSAVGRAFYDDYRLPQGSGMYHLLPEELAFYAMFLLFGGAAVAALWRALRDTSLPAALIGLAGRAAGAGPVAAALVCLFVAVACTLVRGGVLGQAAVSDDEHAYQFIAQTLRGGALVAPSPGSDLAFYREQFVVLTPTARFGKYPIGHPLVLAAGQALGLEPLVMPIVTAGVGAFAFAIGRAVSGAGTGFLAALLFALSPQVLLTGATLASQPTAALCLCAAVAALLADERRPGGHLPSLAGAGAALAFGILARPLPVVLFVPVAAIVTLGRPPYAGARVLRRQLALGLPIAAAVAVMLLVNRAQVGHALVTAYGESLVPGQGPAAILVTTQATFAMRAMSLVGGLVRLNFWLLGWPVSLLLCLLARRTRATGLLWGMVLASLAYRLLSPKVGVGGTGPLYFFEIVPLLCVLTADGARRLARTFPRPAPSPSSLAALLVSATIVSLTLFLPSRLADLERMGAAQNLVEDMIRDRGLSHALVFHEGAVPWWMRLSWAYYPRINSPALDDDVLFVLLQHAGGLAENLDFWKRRYPDRSAWYFGYSQAGPMLVPLESVVPAVAAGSWAAPEGRSPVAR